jgi:ubiquitin-protein ligase E3 C
LASLDPELYQGLIFLKNYAGNPEDLSLDFTISEEGKSLPLFLFMLF